MVEKIKTVTTPVIEQKNTSTKDLKRVLGRGDLMSIAVGQIIGAGIFALTGAAIAMTGKSVNIAFMVAALLVVLMSITQIIVSGTIRMRGGFYTAGALLVGKRFAGFYTIIFIITNIAIAMYALSFADYFLALVPGLNSTLVSVAVLTIFYLANLFGVKEAAKIQNFMVITMAIALTVFIVYGMPQIQPGYFSGADFMPSGMMGIFTAAALLTFATGGANVIVNLGAEAKNPTKDIPFVLIVSTVSVALIYAFMATVAAGVLPISQVANQPLTHVALEVLPYPLFVFFIVGGAMFALATTLNATLGWVTKPVLQASIDGWLPKQLGAINDRFKTPHVLLTIFYFVGLIPIITGWNISGIASFALILNNVLWLIIAIATVRLPKVVPDLWNKSKFKTSKTNLWILSIVATGSNALQVYLLFRELNTTLIIGNIVIFILATLYAIWRDKSGKVNMEISYEEV
ncbi:APC family permease [Ureibacillus acetophenoni]|uniref:Amino acid/polyamine/organocation transporter (APC superfamily) n=1 Tax=Ureibacillus acetophenoni TaxID=614649 RepID=A0A285U9V3_9BACL|nr:amino acid permease [Ureibacillus acetophenoni]SOC38589.1 amino acid/polyamine/organocation transporter (APC superfamily) [Ureibacillus acetophenoni]